MFIEELVIDGFKSYSTRTAVGPFDKQFNAITGLNGSGKSNILDSLCFVLGISNLTQVRVANLSELVYKQGQAGVTKASVTVVFNNEDKSCGPVGYEMHDKITITRQIIIGGRNRYLLNSHNVQANQIQNLFHSVGLNVNNPHFLIMQGRITKVINMKPQETLSMIEEAAGTRMYENKKAGALKTLEKKQVRVDECNRLLAEEITPTLEKLAKDRANYMLWQSNNNEIERLARFCTAFEYMQVQGRLDGKNRQLEEFEALLIQFTEELKEMAGREQEIQADMKSRTAARDSQRSKELKKLEEDHSKMSKEVASTESKLKNKQSDLESQQESRKKGLGLIDEVKAQVDAKLKIFEKEKAKHDKLLEEDNAVADKVEKAQWTIQALTAGMSGEQPTAAGEGEGKSLSGQLLEAQTTLQEMDAECSKKKMAIKSYSERIATAEQVAAKSKADGKRLTKEKGLAEAFITEKKAELAKIKFNPQHFTEVAAKVRQCETGLHTARERIEALRANIGNLNFNYADPYKGFDRNSVKGVVASLFNVKSDYAPDWTRALEVCAGGRLFFVVVDNEQVGKDLLDKGQLRRRVTIIPLNKIADQSIPDNVVREARKVAPSGGEVHSALQIVGYNKEVQTAMKYVFGGHLLCNTPECAKLVTFHPNVRVRTVTKDGDKYDPAGTISGGSAPSGGGILSKLEELSRLEEQVQKQQQEYEQLQKELQKMQTVSGKYDAFEREVKCKEHEYSLIEERINSSEHHVAEKSAQDLSAQVAQFEEDIKNMPSEEKRLKQLVKQLEKDIKSLSSSREDRIAHLEKQVEELKNASKQRADKLDKQREKTETAGVELDVMRNECASQEGQDQSAGQSHDGIAAEVAKLNETFEKQKGILDDLGKQLEDLKAELRQLDETLQASDEELKKLKMQKEEKDLEQKKISHKVQQLQKDDKEAGTVLLRLEKQHPWIEKEKHFFGKTGTDFDFEANSYPDNKTRLDQLNTQQKTLGKNINKKAMAMFEKAEQEYRDLILKRDIILNDKCKIEQVIRDLDEKKSETLRRTWSKVNKDFDSIFGTLLPNANAKLEAPQGMDVTEGLEIKIAFNDIWKDSLTELSGGQRSLLALSLVLALLLFKPAPMYILDEVDSALDLSHTQNIGHMIRQHFPHSQFIVVSLKEGMFNNANCLFRTRFVDGTSTVARYAIRDGGDTAPPAEGLTNPKKRKAPA